MTSDRASSRLPTITVRLTPEEKQRFAELAASRGLSECALAVATLRALLTPGTSSALNIPSGSRREAATDRITIRLRPGDGAALEARAARRRMKTSTYLAALVRSHIAADTVLTAHELETVKQAVVVLAGVGRAPLPDRPLWQPGRLTVARGAPGLGTDPLRRCGCRAAHKRFGAGGTSELGVTV